MNTFGIFGMFPFKKSTAAHPVKYKHSLRTSYLEGKELRFHVTEYITDNEQSKKNVISSIQEKIININAQLSNESIQYININNDFVIAKKNFVCVQRLLENT